MTSMTMPRAWVLGVLALTAVLVIPFEVRAQVAGGGVLAGRLLFRVKGCGKETGPLVITAAAGGNGTWTAVTSEGSSYAGTLTSLGTSGRKLDLQFGGASESAFIGGLAADASGLCGASVTVSSSVRKKFVLQLNRGGTVAKLTLIYTFTGSAGGRQGTAKYRLKAVGPWTPGA
jgi:hypothetical protein